METLKLSQPATISQKFKQHSKFLLLAAQLLLLPGIVAAQVKDAVFAGPAARITTDISTNQRVELPGTLHPLAQPRFDSGRVEAQKRLQGMSMVFSRTAVQQSALNALNAAQQNPSSPQYHKWLTPDEFGTRFGMATADLDRASHWLEREGFTVERFSHSRDRIFFSGTAGQVDTTFLTELHYYTLNGEKHFASSTSLSIPASLAGVVLTISNVDDFKPHPMHHIIHGGEQPGFTSGSTGNHFVSPGDIATIYNVTAQYQAGITGTGQSLAIMGQSFIQLSDIEHFQTASGWAAPKDPTIVLVPGTGAGGITDAGDESESDLDLEWSSTTAPGATIFFVYTGNSSSGGVFQSMEYAVDNRIASIISISYGACENDIGSVSNIAGIETIAQQGITQGQTLIASSGDDGASSCFYDQSDTLAQRAALSVSYPASSPYFTAVGGTQFNEGSGSYWASTPGTDIISSAKSYIPETAWNEDLSSGQIGSTAGGASIFFSKPSWQVGVPGIPADNARDVPDVALDSASAHDGLLFCSSDSYFWPKGQMNSCDNGFRDSVSGVVTEAGGTSFAAPIFAGMVALINQKENSIGQGLITPQLYTLAATPSIYASAFHDITAGDNKCDTGDPSFCPNGATGYSAGVGYDQTTGLGSVDFNNLLTSWGTSPLQQSVLTVVPSATTVSQGATVHFAMTVAPASGTGTPSGSVSLLLDGVAVTPDVTLVNAAGTYTTTLVGNGTHILVSTYSGDTTFAASTATVTLNALTGTNVEISATSNTPLLNAAETFSISVQPTEGLDHPDGSISVSLDGQLISDHIVLDPLGAASYTTSFATAGPHILSVAYAGSAAFSTSTGSMTVNVTAPIVPTTLVITDATSTPITSVDDTFTVSVKPASGTVLPSGVVTVSVDGNPTAASPTLTNGAASFTMSFKSAGPHVVQVAYAGDSSFGASLSSITITVPVESFSLTAAAVSMASGSSSNSVITITPANGYAGTIAFTVSSAAPQMANACVSAIANTPVVSSAAQTVSLAISTGQATCVAGTKVAYGANHDHDLRRGSSTGSTTIAATLAGLFLLCLVGKARRLRPLAAVLLLTATIGMISGCGGGNKPVTTPTASGTYTIKVTGQDTVTATMTSSTIVTVVVQ